MGCCLQAFRVLLYDADQDALKAFSNRDFWQRRHAIVADLAYDLGADDYGVLASLPGDTAVKPETIKIVLMLASTYNKHQRPN